MNTPAQNENPAQRVEGSDPTGFDQLRLGDLPGRAAQQWGDRPALMFGEQQWTHAQFSADVDRVAKGLMATGVESGAHVGLWMTNRPEWLHVMYAVTRIGGCLVPLNTRYRSDDMAFTVVDAECQVLITMDESGPINYAALLAEARTDIDAAGFLDTVVMLGTPHDGTTPWDDMLQAGEAITDSDLAERVAAVDAEQLMMLA